MQIITGTKAIVNGIPNLLTIRPVANNPVKIARILTARSIWAHITERSGRLRSLKRFFNSKYTKELMPVYKKINTPIDSKYGFEKNNLKPASGLPPIERLDAV